MLIDNNIEISMDGKWRWMDNVFIERLWRSLKYECVYLQAFESGSEARNAIGRWIDFYNTKRPLSTFDGQTLDKVYNQAIVAKPQPMDMMDNSPAIPLVRQHHPRELPTYPQAATSTALRGVINFYRIFLNLALS